MKNLLRATLLIAMILLLGVSHLSAANFRVNHPQVNQLTAYGKLSSITDQGLDLSRSQGRSNSSLGAFVSDGGSPGYIVGRTYKDDQNHLNPGRMIGWGTNPQVHFIYCIQPTCGGLYNPSTCARWIHYNMFDPTTAPGGVFISGTVGIPLQTNPFGEGGMYPALDVDENGRMIGVAEAIDADGGGVRWSKLWWDVSTSGWGTFTPDSIPDQITGTGFAENRHYPVVAYQEFGGLFVTHIVALDGLDPADGADKVVTYWRKTHTQSGLGGSWTSMMVADGPWSDTYDVGVSPDGAGKTAIAWCQERDSNADVGSAIWLITSADAGATWSTAVDVVAWEEGTPSWQAWNECNVVYDTDNFLHIVYNAKEYDGTSMGEIDPARILHWSDRVPGDDAGGTTSLIQAFDFHGFETMCGRFSHNLLVVGMPVISECNGRLYTIWMQSGDPDRGDSTDCVAEDPGPVFLGSYNSDIRMSVSLSLDGTLWDSRRNLTDSKTPECDGTDENPCDHDAWGTMTRHGMDSRVSVIGANYWSAVPEAFEVRDALDVNYPDTGFYLDVQFINDLLPESAMFLGDAFWTLNPIKWFRLPCVAPVIEPDILITQEPFVHPASWIPSGQQVQLDLVVNNIGNEQLNVSSISANVIQGTNWLQINTASLSIPAAGSDIVSLTINPNLINPGPGLAEAIEGWVYIDSDDNDTPRDSFLIRTVITDTVIQIAKAVITTGLGMQLGALNNGSAANWPNTGGYMGFENDSTGLHADCDSQEVYLYEMSPIIMYDASTYFWNTYYDFSDPEPGVNFVPVLGDELAEQCSSGGMDQYLTGDFVTADSAITMRKVWVAPDDNVSFVIEKWLLFCEDDEFHTGVTIAEWSDCDVPSDTSVNNRGTIVQADDYVYVSGQETDGASCEANDGRFYVHGLLGYYTMAEYDLDSLVNNTGLSGAYVVQVEDLMPADYEFNADSVWDHLTRDEFTANNSRWDDQRTLLDFGTFDIGPGDTLVLWIMHGALINSSPTGVAEQVAAAKVWYMEHRDDVGICGCCGLYTGGLVGNVDFDTDGKFNLTDITRLIDRVYVSKLLLDCEANGDIAEPLDGKVNLADITRLIDRVYVSKATTSACQ